MTAPPEDDEIERRVEARTLALRAENEGLARELAAVRESEERYRRIFERASDAIFILGAEGELAGQILMANTAAASMHGYGLDELARMKLRDLGARAVSQPASDRFRKSLLDAWIEGETLHARKDGTVFPVEYSAGSLNLGGKGTLLVFMRDITERRHAEEALRQAKDAADAANRAKSAFLANMSHEIRTPMNAILGYTQLLQRDPTLQKSQAERLEVIRRGGEHLLDLINDVLEISKIEAGHRKLARGNVDLRALLDDLEHLLRLRADAKRLTFGIHRASNVPRYIVSDEGKLRQIFVNLLGNAVKFTEEGGVMARLRVRPGSPDARGIVLCAEVEDTGPGIGPDELAGLFQPFAQTRVGVRARGGTGLGLAISREFTRLLGGDIAIESTPGKGSIFRFEIPIEIGRPPISGRPAPRSGRVVGIAGTGPSVRILVVDDDEDTRSWLRQLLGEVGFDVREATDGEAAVAAFEAWRPHAILMDMNMPVLDGYAATRRIRALAPERSTVILAVTASAFDDVRDAIFEAGADGWLRKPCREGDLLEEVRGRLGLEYRYVSVARTSSSASFPAVRRSVAPGALLPPELSEPLREAARIADYERVTELIGELPPEYAAAAEELHRLAECFAYDKIEAALNG